MDPRPFPAIDKLNICCQCGTTSLGCPIINYVRNIFQFPRTRNSNFQQPITASSKIFSPKIFAANKHTHTNTTQHNTTHTSFPFPSSELPRFCSSSTPPKNNKKIIIQISLNQKTLFSQISDFGHRKKRKEKKRKLLYPLILFVCTFFLQVWGT